DDDRVGSRGLRFAGAAVLAAHWPGRLRLELGYVDERQCGWCGDDLDGPATVLGQFYQPSDLACGPRPAHDHVQDPALARLCHLGAPMRAANSLRCGRTVGGAVARRSPTRRRTAGRERTSWGAIPSAARRAW